MLLIKKVAILILFVLCFQTAKADWVKQESNSLAWFHDVYFLNENRGWIAGSDGTLLVTIDGGKIWKKEKNFTADTIREVYFADEKNGWLLCERNIYNLGSFAPSYLMKTSDGGAHWESVEFGNDKRKKIAKIFFNKTGSGAAIGEGGTYLALQDDQKTWKKMSSPVQYLMLDGIFTDESNGAMVGAGGTILFTENAGLSWNKSNFSGNTKLNAVFFVNQKMGWTVGSGGKIYQTFNGGKTWREQNSNVDKDLTGVFFRDTAEGWAIGAEGLMLHTTTAGNIWTVVDSTTKHRLEKISFVGKKGWSVGFGGTILSYNENSEKADSTLESPNLKRRN